MPQHADTSDTAAILRSRARELRVEADQVTTRSLPDAMVWDLIERYRVRLNAEADGLDRAAEVLEATLTIPDLAD